MIDVRIAQSSTILPIYVKNQLTSEQVMPNTAGREKALPQDFFSDDTLQWLIHEYLKNNYGSLVATKKWSHNQHYTYDKFSHVIFDWICEVESKINKNSSCFQVISIDASINMTYLRNQVILTSSKNRPIDSTLFDISSTRAVSKKGSDVLLDPARMIVHPSSGFIIKTELDPIPDHGVTTAIKSNNLIYLYDKVIHESAVDAWCVGFIARLRDLLVQDIDLVPIDPTDMVVTSDYFLPSLDPEKRIVRVLKPYGLSVCPQEKI